MYKWLGQLSGRHPWAVCAVWVALAAVMALIAPNWDNRSQDDDIRFLPARCPSVRGYQLLQKAFPQDVFASRLLFALERPEAPLNEADFALVDAMLADLAQLKSDEPNLGINRIASHRDPFIGKRLLSQDGHCTLISVALASPYLALQTRTTAERADQVVQARLKKAGSQAPQLYTTGPAGIGRDLINATAQSLDSTTLATIVLVVIILLAVYRAPLLALVPLASIALSVVVALKMLALGTLIPGFHLMNISQIFAVVMLYGAGTDYCLFLISRYREELTRGHDLETALARAVKAVGSPLVASAGTVVCGLGMMILAEFAKVRCGGPAIGVSLIVALAASLTLAPSLLRLLGPAAFWPLPLPRYEILPRNDLWTRLSDRVLARPGWILGISVAVLLPLALVGFRVQASYKATAELASGSSSIAGLAAIQRHFNAGEVGPVTVLLDSPKEWTTRDGRALIQNLSRGFACLDNVVEVRSLTQPLGESAAPCTYASMADGGQGHQPVFPLSTMVQQVRQGLEDQVTRLIADHYVSHFVDEQGVAHHVARLDVVCGTDPFDPRGLPAIEVIQLWLKDRMPEEAQAMGEVRAETYGVAVNGKDLAEVTERDRVRINAMVLAAVFCILLALVRKPWLAGYLLLTVLFSYYVTLGATTLMAWMHTGRPIGEVDWRVPFFLFTILVAVGEDYNILLVTRALKERRRHGWYKGMRIALSRTGGTITSCGLIMAGTFATLMLAGLNTLIQIGFALAFGVLVDTFIVRPFLVPAMLILVWRQEGDSVPTWRERRKDSFSPYPTATGPGGKGPKRRGPSKPGMSRAA